MAGGLIVVPFSGYANKVRNFFAPPPGATDMAPPESGVPSAAGSEQMTERHQQPERSLAGLAKGSRASTFPDPDGPTAPPVACGSLWMK